MGSDEIRRIQQALRDQGFNPGEIDGVWGRATMGAVRRFQKRSGLQVDGIVGPMTWRALLQPHAPQPEGEGAFTTPLVWYEEALNLVGTTEVAGGGNNRQILAWARDLNIDYEADDIPWCGLFVAHCIGATLPEEQMPSTPLWARAWRRFGVRCDPCLGAVMVFWRGSPSASTGHVCFYHAEDGTAYHVLGGNQSNRVNLTRIPKTRLLDARWPTTASALKGQRVQGAADQPLSVTEQ